MSDALRCSTGGELGISEVVDMRSRIGTLMVVVAGGVCRSAVAQDVEAPAGTVLAPRNAVEIGVEGGYTQPFGMIDRERNIHDTAKAGGAVGLSLGYRFSPVFAFGATGQFHESVPDSTLGSDGAVRGVAAGVQAAFHFMPYRMIDPYATVGSGYRLLWQSPTSGENTLTHGFEAVKATAGVDFRVNKNIALGPVIGADLNVFLWDRSEANGVNNTIANKSVNTFLFGGLGGKFDIGGKREPEYERTTMPTPAAGPAIAREVKPAEPPAPAPAPAPAPMPESAPPSTGVSIDEAILAQCHISQPKAFFEFDKSNLSSCDLSTINDVAACFATGPMKGRKLYIVGHADPRGSDEYNMKLGESRADSVEKYMEREGVPSANLNTLSMGKRQATGVDESGWAYDRRVEIKLNP